MKLTKKKTLTFVPTFVIKFTCLKETGIPLHCLSVYYVSKSLHQWFIVWCVMSDVIATKYYFLDVYTGSLICDRWGIERDQKRKKIDEKKIFSYKKKKIF